jgi:hypothetical protein
VDGGTDAAVADAGGNACPASFPAAAVGAEEQTNQNIVISRVVFADGDATVFFLGMGNGEGNFADPMVLCAGPENCIEDVQDLDNEDNLLQVGQEVSVTIENVSPEEGELALMTNDPVVPEAFPFAYIAWGEDFVSEDPTGGDAAALPASLEVRADEANFWELGQRIIVDANQDTIFITGDSALAEGFGICTSGI